MSMLATIKDEMPTGPMDGAGMRDLRTGIGITQADLGELIGVSRSTVLRYEKGTMAIPDATALLVRLIADYASIIREGD